MTTIHIVSMRGLYDLGVSVILSQLSTPLSVVLMKQQSADTIYFLLVLFGVGGTLVSQ